MTVRLREAMASLPGYVPGRTVPGAIKLASNETPLPPLPHVLERIAQAASTVNRYPDNWSRELGEALAARFGVDAERVVVGCGSVSLCYQLGAAVAGPGDEVLYAWRAFEAYPIVTAISGADPVQVPLRDHVHDLPAMAARLSDRTRLIFICNPNNPTGTVVHRAELAEFLAAVPDDVVVVVDEAYHEFVTDPDVTDAVTLLDEHPEPDRAADVQQGLRPGRACASATASRATSRSPRRFARRRAPSPSRRSPSRRRWRASSPRPSRSSWTG